VTTRASGPFDVKLNPLDKYDTAAGSLLSRLSLDKQYRGDLEATGVGEMLATGTSVKGSAGYVAMERVTGTLHGKRGTFVFQHSSTLNRGAPTQRISVVPDSGTDQLTGLTGTMEIKIDDGKHSYLFEYSLPGAP
jgi:uncharacterized protein DUF3224